MPGVRATALSLTLKHPLARMLPLFRYQEQVYRMGEKLPPGLQGYGPDWECVTLVLPPQGTLQARVQVQRDYHLLAVKGLASEVMGGSNFRFQLYDLKKKRLLTDRGVLNLNLAGGEAFFLREPYRFDLPDSQILVMVQSFATASNTIQLMLYGACVLFNAPGGISWPGGPIPRTAG